MAFLIVFIFDYTSEYLNQIRTYTYLYVRYLTEIHYTFECINRHDLIVKVITMNLIQKIINHFGREKNENMHVKCKFHTTYKVKKRTK